MNRLGIALKAAQQLGLQPIALNALYRFGLVSGHYRRTERRESSVQNRDLLSLFTFPSPKELLVVLGEEGKTALFAEADEIIEARVRLFGTNPVDLKLTLPGNLEHWTAYETGKSSPPLDQFPLPDIKFIWEPARFGWAFTLGRAFHLSSDEKYAQAFWRFFEIFSDANPPFLGPNWISGQEAALRLMAFVWAKQVFETANASTPDRMSRLVASVSAHAARIPPTLVYARSQQNNHLLIEAAGLLTAGLALADHADAARWRTLGWRWINQGLQSQIDGYGEYVQHSTNYQRLMLQVVLWINALAKKFDLRWPQRTLEAVRRSVHWQLALMDFESGQTPNLGANDGASIFPLSVHPFEDFRPVLHAAARAFIDYDLPHGSWDEMSLWLGTGVAGSRSISLPRYLGDQLYGKDSWAYFRTAQFTSRPSHADQLHLDLWWRGLNVAKDAGTYLYNTTAPWDNSLTATRVHNTVTVDGRDQFTRAGRFLYLDWVNAYRQNLIPDGPAMLQKVRGRYRRGGYRHTRIVSVFEDDRWLVEDEILPLRIAWQKKSLASRQHWLLPDWEWELEEGVEKFLIRLKSPYGWVNLGIQSEAPAMENKFQVTLVRAGEYLHGSGLPDPTRGWVSPTYGIKIPALSLAGEMESRNEAKFTTEFIFPK